LEIVDNRGSQELQERLITIKRPRLKKIAYILSDEELAKIPEMLRTLRKSDIEETSIKPSSPPLSCSSVGEHALSQS
jgi:hypothetical protein